MIFFLGILSVLQITILPGLIVTKLFKFNNSFLFFFNTTVILSLLINYIIITLLLFINFYIKEFFYFLIGLEFIVILSLYPKTFFIKKKISIINIFIIIISICCILLALYKNTGNVFYAWDALISYNEWAKEFANGNYPGGMVRPYLIPKLWSLTYVMIQSNEIQLFAKFLTAIFPICIILICLDNILKHQRLFNYIEFFFYLIFFYYKRNFILTGYVDIPLLTIVVYFFYYLRQNITPSKKNALFFLVIFTGGLIKLSSYFLLPLFYFYCQNKKYLFSLISVFLLYLFFLYNKIFFGSELSSKLNIFNEMSQISNFNFYQNILYSFFLLKKENLIIFFFPLLFSFFFKQCRIILLHFIIPGLIYWSMLLSYDYRNMLFTIPAIIYCNSYVVSWSIKRILNFNIKKRKILNKIINFHFILKKKIIISFFLLILLLSFFVQNKNIINKNHIMQSKLGHSELNKIIFSLIKQNKLNSDNFLTDYQIIFFIPMFKNIFNYENNYYTDNINNFSNYHYLLIFGHAKKMREHSKILLKNKNYKIFYEKNGLFFVGK